MEFTEAVQALVYEARAGPFPAVPDKPLPPEKEKAFALPARNRNDDRAFAYLRSRGIDQDILRQCMETKILYEGRKYHNCVFVGQRNAKEPERRMEQPAFFLSLSGVSPLALLHFLREHPKVNHIVLGLEQDKAVLEAMEKIRAAVYEDEGLRDRTLCITISPPHTGKPCRVGRH